MRRTFDRYTAPGTDKRILYLGVTDTIRYLVIQSLDMIKDAMSSGAFTSEINLARFIVDSAAAWIYTNNECLHYLKYSGFNAFLWNNFLSYWRGSAEATLNSLRPDRSGIPITNGARRVVVDQCNENILAARSAFYCKKDSIGTGSSKITFPNSNTIITQSTLYDLGAGMTNCGALKYIYTKSMPAPMSFSNNYTMDLRVQKMISARPTYICKDIIPTACIDNCIYGDIMFNNNVHHIVCAHMSVSGVKLSNYDCVQYNHVISPGKFSVRGYAPSNKLLEGLYKDINGNNPGSTDILLIYTELAAKHWGDLGLVFDVLSSDVFIVSNDRTVKILCDQFGANYMDENYEYPAISRNSNDVYFKMEYNTASVFGRG